MQEQDLGRYLTTPEVVGLNQRFLLFNPFNTKSVLNRRSHIPEFRVREYFSSVVLQFRDFPEILIYTSATAAFGKTTQAIIPTDPSSGYVIDNDDFDISRRIKKVCAWRKNPEKKIDYSKTPLFISAYNLELADLKDTDWVEKTTYGYQVADEFLPILQGLRLQVVIGGFAFEGEPDKLYGRERFYFNKFSPIDYPEVSMPESSLDTILFDLSRTFSIYIPSDEEMIQTIEGAFRFADTGDIGVIPQQ